MYWIPRDEVNYVWYLSHVATSLLSLDEFGEAPDGNIDSNVVEDDYVQSVNQENGSKIVKYHTGRMKEVTEHVSHV